jgi:hypothetical protein
MLYLSDAVRLLIGRPAKIPKEGEPKDVATRYHLAETPQKRVHDRTQRQVAVLIQDCDTGSLFPATMQNFSRGGMYLETETAPRVHSGIIIHMANYDRNAAAPEDIPKYYSQVKWCNKLSGMVVFVRYGVGVKFCDELDDFIRIFSL